MLPFFDNCFIFAYLVIYLVLAFGFYLLANINNKKEIKKDLKSKKHYILMIFITMIILALIVTIITKKYAVAG
jgi:ABC-type sugar transport system permease subunit